MTPFKYCRTCLKYSNNFSFHPRSRDGFKNECRPCFSERIRRTKIGKLNPQYGKPHSAESNQARSLKLKGRVFSPQHKENHLKAQRRPEVRIKRSMPGRLNPMYGKNTPGFGGIGKGAWFTDRRGRVMWLRSSWEIKVAEYLDAQKLTWEYELLRFPLEHTTYCPDFWVEEWDCFWEVKGWLSPKFRDKIKEFREDYPDWPVVVVSEPVYEMVLQS